MLNDIHDDNLKKENYLGKKFHYLTVLKFDKMVGKEDYCFFKCDCGVEKSIRLGSVKNGKCKSCGCLKKIGSKTNIEKLSNKIKSNVLISTTGCWEFTGNLNISGYGLFSYDQEKTAHRSSWRLFKGEIPKGAYVLHKCDNRKCCNPDHLYLGTAKDNMRDVLERNRRPQKYRKLKKRNEKKHRIYSADNGNKMPVFDNEFLYKILNTLEAMRECKFFYETGYDLDFLSRVFVKSEDEIIEMVNLPLWDNGHWKTYPENPFNKPGLKFPTLKEIINKLIDKFSEDLMRQEG